jgi:hypothetical protein
MDRHLEPKMKADIVGQQIERLYQTACLVIGDKQLAEEVTHAVVTGVGDSHVEPALLAQDHGVSLYRKLYEYLRFPADRPLEEQDSPDSAAPVSHENHRRVAAIKSLTPTRVGMAIRLLPWNLRLPLVLCIREELTYQEIAMVLDTSRASARRLVHRGRRLLADHLTTMIGSKRLHESLAYST